MKVLGSTSSLWCVDAALGELSTAVDDEKVLVVLDGALAGASGLVAGVVLGGEIDESDGDCP